MFFAKLNFPRYAEVFKQKILLVYNIQPKYNMVSRYRKVVPKNRPPLKNQSKREIKLEINAIFR